MYNTDMCLEAKNDKFLCTYLTILKDPREVHWIVGVASELQAF